MAPENIEVINIGKFELVEQELFLLNTTGVKVNRKSKMAIMKCANASKCIYTFSFLLLLENEFNGVHFEPDKTSF